MKPLISVIIPAHNSSKTIGTAIDSILNQTYPNLEVIVVDDNSTDNTKEVVEKIAKQNSNLKYYHLPYDDPNRVNKRGRNINAGYMARNYGFEKINGEWITFQDADDSSLSNRIEVQYNLAIKHAALHVCVDWQKFDKSYLGKKLDVSSIIKEHPDFIIKPNELTMLAKKTKGVLPKLLGKFHSFIPFELKRFRVFNKLFFGTLDNYPGAGNSPLFKAEVIKKIKFRQLNDRVWPSFMGRGADRDFNFQVAETFKNSTTFKLPLYLWRMECQNEDYYNYQKYII